MTVELEGIRPTRRSSASDGMGRVRRAVYRMRAPWALLQVLLIGSSIAMVALWLQLPDGNRLEMTLSLALAIGGVAAFAWGQSSLLAMVRRRGGERAAAWKGALLLVGLALVYQVVATFFDAGQIQDIDRAAGWVRHARIAEIASVATLLRIQGAAWWLLRWVLLAALLPLAMEGAACEMRGQWPRRAVTVLREPLFLVALLVSAGVGTLVTGGLLQLRPQLPVVLEFLLTVLKVTVIAAVDLGLICFVLSLLGTYLRDAERVRPEARAVLPSSGRRRRR